MSFNASQTRAIHHKNGPMLVLAGPGSGKTLVITERTKYLIEECGIDPAPVSYTHLDVYKRQMWNIILWQKKCMREGILERSVWRYRDRNH